MRLCIAVALLLPFGTAAWAQSQDNGGSALFVPPAPPIAAAPIAPPAPVAPTPPAPPPGLVQTPIPPGPVVPEQAPPDYGVPNSGAPAEEPPAGAVPPTAPPALPAVIVPGSPAPAGPPGAAPVPPPAPAPPDVAPVIPNDWVQGKVATLGVLNKVDGSTTQVSIPVGGQSHVGDLQVSVQACATRPPDQLPDTAIFLTVQGATPSSDVAGTGGVPVFGTTLYRGWMVRSDPGATVVGDGGEMFRVVNCS